MRKLLASLGLAVLVAAGASNVAAQEAGLPDVVSKVVAVGPDEARLTLELTDGRSLELALRGGEVRMGDQVLGRYEEGGALEASWRELVARSVTLEDKALLEALVDWAPPQGLDEGSAAVASRMDEFLTLNFDSTALRGLALEATRESRALEESIVEGLRGLEGLAILSRLDVLARYGEAVGDMDTDDLRVVIDDHLEIGAGTSYPGSILIIDGSLELRGTVEGDVTVIDGEVELRPGSRIRGTLRMAEARLDNDGGSIGQTVELTPHRSLPEGELNEILREARNEARAASRDRGPSIGGAFREAFNAVGSVLGRLFSILILGLVGAALFHFADPNMEAISQTARNSTGRAALVGMAGAALALPVFILGILGLAVSIVGIPAILLWLPLFPAAVAFACIAGYLAVARNVGAWLSRQRYPYLEWVRITNPVTLVFGGLLTLAAPFLAADLLEVVPFLDVFGFLLVITGFFASAFAGAVGLGAVLLTRGGRKPEDWGPGAFGRGWREGRWNWRSRDWEDARSFDEELGTEPAGAPESTGDESDRGTGAGGGDASRGDSSPAGQEQEVDDEDRNA